MDDDVLALVRRSLMKLSAAETRVAETILGDPTLVVDLACIVPSTVPSARGASSFT